VSPVGGAGRVREQCGTLSPGNKGLTYERAQDLPAGMRGQTRLAWRK
jgi:hypothetical protein